MSEPENPPIPLAAPNEEIPTELLLCSEKITDILADNSEPPDEESRTSDHTPEEEEQQQEVTSSHQGNLIFECTVKPASFLKSAVEALIDPEFNQNESGRIDVDHLGFNITVRNLGNNSISHLRLKPSEFGCCSRQLIGKTINLHGLSLNLAHVEDEGTIRVNCQKGNIDQLNFLMSVAFHLRSDASIGYFMLNFETLWPENAAHTEFSAEFLKNHAEIQRYPVIPDFYQATLPPEDSKQMLQNLLQQKPPQVVVEIKDFIASLKVGTESSWEGKYKLSGSGGVIPGQSYHGRFQWTNVQSLQKMSQLDVYLMIRIQTAQPRCIILRFFIQGLGYLNFIKEPIP